MVQREEGTRRGLAIPGPSSLYQMLTVHPSTASVPITVLLYNGPLLCGFNLPVNKRLKWAYATFSQLGLLKCPMHVANSAVRVAAVA